MKFKILNNRIVSIIQAEASMFCKLNRHYAFPISKISNIDQVDRCLRITLDCATTIDHQYDTQNEAEQAYGFLIKIMGGEQEVHKKNEGPSPDLWAMEQLK